MRRRSANTPLGGDDEGSSGDKEVRNAAGVKKFVDAGEDTGDGRYGEQPSKI